MSSRIGYTFTEEGRESGHAAGPARKHDDDAGADLTSTEKVTLEPLGRALVPTGVKMKLPENTVGYVCPRSGLASKQGVTVLNAPGVVDEGYTGEIKVILINLSNETVVLEAGTRIAQLVVQPVEYVEYVHVHVSSQENKEKDTGEILQVKKSEGRGDSGFGSTGL